MVQEHEGDAAQTEDRTGRFVRTDKKLGGGTTKTVYQARDEEEGVDVAWNELSTVNPSTRAKFMNEVHILESLDHPNILKCTTHFEEAEKPVFITEMMPGGTLKSFIAQSKNHRLKLRVVQKICRQLLKALEYLHSQDPPVIHSDLRCENIFIDAHNCEVKVANFGLSGRQGTIMAPGHKVEFLAPEAVGEDGKYTCKGDVHAFGMCVLEMVTGQSPYAECEGDEEMVKLKLRSGEPPRALDAIVAEEYRVPTPQGVVTVREFIRLCLAPLEERPTSSTLAAHGFITTNIPAETTVHGPVLDPHNLVQDPRIVAFPTPPQSPFVPCSCHSDPGSNSSTHQGNVALVKRRTQNDIYELAVQSERASIQHRRCFSWPSSPLEKPLTRRNSNLSVCKVGSINLDDTAVFTPSSRSTIYSFVRQRPRSTPTSIQLTKDVLLQWGQLFPPLMRPPTVTKCSSDLERGEDGLPPSLIKSVPSPSDASSVMNSEEHAEGSLTPHDHYSTTNGHLKQLCCETGQGVAIQKLLDDEVEILERLRHLEREYQERAARRNERLKKLEEELRRHGLGIPTNIQIRPPRKSISVARDAVTISQSPLPESESQGPPKRPTAGSGSDMDAWDSHSPPTSQDSLHKKDNPPTLGPASPCYRPEFTASTASLPQPPGPPLADPRPPVRRLSNADANAEDPPGPKEVAEAPPRPKSPICNTPLSRPTAAGAVSVGR